MLDRKVPCSTCPFRTGQGAFRNLGTARATEIAESLLKGESFTCHSDIHRRTHDRNQCVGAMLILDKLEQPNQIMQIASRLKLFDATQLQGRDDVFDNFDAWVVSQHESGGYTQAE